MPFSTENSSFILLRRLLSIKLCAVFLAIFRPAALVALGCFFFPFSPEASFSAAAAAAAFFLPPDPLPLPLVESLAEVLSSDSLGFICIIFRDRVGGGGNAKVPSFSLAVDDLRRALTASAGCIRKVEVLGELAMGARILVLVGDSLADSAGETREASWMAGGGSSNESWKVESCWMPSLPLISEDEPGVRGNPGRGMVE